MTDQGSLTPVAIATTVTPLVGANAQRRSLTLPSGTTNPYWVSDRPDVAAGAGIHVPANTQALVLDQRVHGEWMQRGLFAISTGGTVNIAILEVICPCQGPPLPA